MMTLYPGDVGGVAYQKAAIAARRANTMSSGAIAIPDMTAQDPSLTSAQTDVTSSSDGSGTSTLQSVLGSLIPLGYNITGAITNRPVIVNPTTGSYTLGQTPLVSGPVLSGSISATTLAILVVAGLVVYYLAKGK